MILFYCCMGLCFLWWSYISISLWSYSIWNLLKSMVGKLCYFNFIMILFYFFFNLKDVYNVLLFQFHYDLILFWLIINNNYFYQIFQFHYDLILFINTTVLNYNICMISISLWSYSISTSPWGYAYVDCISISLWSYSISIKFLLLSISKL